jgi:hypothetical protein
VHFQNKARESEQTYTLFGVDELQALQLALGFAADRLRQMNLSLSLDLKWEGDENGDLGIHIPEIGS